MRVGILGSGLMGGKLGTLFARAGHEVVFSYSRSERKLNALAREAGKNARAGTPAEAAKDADAVLFAVHWSRFDDVLSQAGDLSGKVVVTAGRASSTAAMKRAERRWPPRSFATWDSSRWMLGPCASRATPSRSGSSSESSLTQAPAARSLRIDSYNSASSGEVRPTRQEL
jgi:hypothetical protein